MSKFAPFGKSTGVMDVFFSIVYGDNNVKLMVFELKQPQSSISRKLMFLRENRIVIKDKWKYETNWKEVDKVFLREVKRQMEAMITKEKINYFISIFNEKRVRNIIETYASHFTKKKIRNAGSIQQIIQDYFYGMAQVDDKNLEKIDKRFIELKAHFNTESSERSLFMNSEGVEI